MKKILFIFLSLVIFVRATILQVAPTDPLVARIQGKTLSRLQQIQLGNQYPHLWFKSGTYVQIINGPKYMFNGASWVKV